MSIEERMQAPEWFYERFYENTVKGMFNIPELTSFTMEWFISKPTMVATLNYLRSNKKLKCEWIEKAEGLYMIKISKTNTSPSKQ